MDVLIYLTSIAVVLLIGLLISILSNKLRITNILLLIFAGIASTFIKYKGEAIFQFSPVFLVSIAILALVMIVFDGTSRMKFKDIDVMSYKALKVTAITLIFNLIFVGFTTYLLFFNKLTITNIIVSLVFAVLMAGTDPASVFILFKKKTSKVFEFLKIEAIVNTPIVVIIPFILLEFVTGGEAVSVLAQVGPFLQQIVTGVGTGIVIGIIIFKIMKKTYSEQYSAIALLTATLITYIIAENLGGNGVLAVATLGLLFGNMYVKKKTRLSEFSSILSTSLEILVFVLIGVVIQIPWEAWFFVKSIVLFFILILCRYLSLKISLGKDLTKKELIFMTLNMPKGIAIATVIFSIALIDVSGISMLVNLTLITMIYSLIVSTFMTWSAKSFIELTEIEEVESINEQKKINFIKTPNNKLIKKAGKKSV